MVLSDVLKSQGACLQQTKEKESLYNVVTILLELYTLHVVIDWKFHYLLSVQILLQTNQITFC